MRYKVTLLSRGYTTIEQLPVLINYMLQAGGIKDAESFIRALAQRSPQQKEKLMTFAEMLEQKGLEQGLNKGRQEGVRLGEQKSKLEVAHNMQENGLDVAMVMKMTGLTKGELKQLQH